MARTSSSPISPVDDAEGVAARIEAAGGKASALPIDVRDTGGGRTDGGRA